MNSRQFHPDGSAPGAGAVFVFGSNRRGAHLGGASYAAHHLYGASWGVAEGRTGHAYAIPTVDVTVSERLPLAAIRESVDRFLAYVGAHPHLQFCVTRIGCGIAGHKDTDIAPMFFDAPANCSLPDTWAPLLANPTESEVEHV